MACKCIACGECNGNGRVRISFDDDLVSCPDCDGSGLSEVCEECRDAEWDDEDRHFA